MELAGPRPAARGADIFTMGFATAVAMWAVGYFARLFGPAVPAPALFALMVGCLVCGGFAAGRWTTRGASGLALSGIIVGLVNLLIVGSLVSREDAPGAVLASAWMWVVGAPVVCVGGFLIGAFAGRLVQRPATLIRDWRPGPPLVAMAATLVLLGAGGLVTGFDEGLAVADWPTSEGYNMFLYPLARMTGGVYLEHAHRLLGSLVGVVMLSLAIYTQFTERRGWVRGLVWLLGLAVLVQGVLGGLRVTGYFTADVDAGRMRPNIVLGAIHGVFGQVIFAGLVALCVVSTARWRSSGVEPDSHAGAGLDRGLAALLVVLTVLQVAVGAMVRHFTWVLDGQRSGLSIDPQTLMRIGAGALHAHIALAVVVLCLSVAVGVRAWGLYAGPLRTGGVALLGLNGVQLVLGLLALVVTGDDAITREPTVADVAVTTLHQLTGASILACATLTWVWLMRSPLRSGASEATARLGAAAAV